MAGRHTLRDVVLGLAVFGMVWSLSGSAFVARPSSLPQQGLATATGVASGALVAQAPAFAGEPPSVGEHWYWDLPGGFNVHGEVVSVLMMILTLYIVFALIGMGGSSRKSDELSLLQRKACTCIGDHHVACSGTGARNSTTRARGEPEASSDK
eukprot:CAMPEP_0178400156 /NCGR_PEP_ID=MMETSP0689_2-20121128/15645_1 /TAXON_ID=160604 /ORGANISM="Amphidinium massartii, Strain CS-259" /LENGTH=152 /DNA_ID=CAMNT_0020020945 /DNA_START=58 /DNA_END=514 /DNA_ORIENTATION=+